MSSYRQILYHIIFRTKNSRRSLPPEHARQLFAYIYGIIKIKNCHLYRINGVEDHIHILTSLRPDLALADLIRDIKKSSSIWLKTNGDFPDFDGWASGYAALTYSWQDKDVIIKYIRNQQEHHRSRTFSDELRHIVTEQGIKIDEQFFP